MSNTTDTNQASEDELREKINSALFADDFPILNDIEKDAVDRILALIRTEKLKLLAEVREQVIGKDCSDEVSGGSCLDCEMDSGYYANVHNELKDEQRTALTKLEAEL